MTHHILYRSLLNLYELQSKYHSLTSCRSIYAAIELPLYSFSFNKGLFH